MSTSFLQKSIWSQEDWASFFAKLDMLRFRENLRKGDFSKRIGVWNIYRKNVKRPDPFTLDRICHLYNVTLEWLCSHEYEEPAPPVKVVSSTPAHRDLIEQFRDKEWAMEVNALLLDIEKAGENLKDVTKAYLKGLADCACALKKSQDRS